MHLIAHFRPAPIPIVPCKGKHPSLVGEGSPSRWHDRLDPRDQLRRHRRLRLIRADEFERAGDGELRAPAASNRSNLRRREIFRSQLRKRPPVTLQSAARLARTPRLMVVKTSNSRRLPTISWSAVRRTTARKISSSAPPQIRPLSCSPRRPLEPVCVAPVESLARRADRRGRGSRPRSTHSRGAASVGGRRIVSRGLSPWVPAAWPRRRP